MRAASRNLDPPHSSGCTQKSRKTVGYFLRGCGNLHYFAAIKPYLDHYLGRTDIENCILVNELTPGFEEMADFQGYVHLFTANTRVSDCDLVLTPSFLRHQDRPGLDRQKTRVVQIFHGMSDKPFTYERDFSDYDLCLCIGQRQLDRLLSHEWNRDINWSLVGYPKFDTTPNASRPSVNGRKTIIYCPTWRKGGISSIESFLENPSVIARLTERYDVIIKPHPNLFNPDRPFFDQSIVERLQGIPNITLIRSGNVMPLLARSDLFIGDISATGYEWLYFGRPMVFLNPQPGQLDRSDDINAMTYLWHCGNVCNDITELPAAIEHSFNNDLHAQQREKLLNYSVLRPRDKGATLRAIEQIDTLLAGTPSHVA